MSPENSSGKAVWLSPEEKPLSVEQAKPVAPIPMYSPLPSRDWAGVAHRVMDGAGSAWRTFWKFVKLAICLGLDVLDFFIGRLLGFGIGFDLGCTLICAALWGKRGWWCLLEVADITEQIDAFIPTCTIIALKAWNDN